MRQLSLATLAVLTLALPAAASEPQSGPLERREAVLAELGPVEQAWAELRASLAGDRLAAQLSPALAGAVLRSEAAVAGGEIEAHQAAAGLGAVVLEAARAAGAEPGAISSLELALREALPRLVATSTLAQASGQAPQPPEAGAAADRAELRARWCELRPADCASLSDELVETRLLEALRRRAAAALPGEIALELRRRIAPGLPEALR